MMLKKHKLDWAKVEKFKGDKTKYLSFNWHDVFDLVQGHPFMFHGKGGEHIFIIFEGSEKECGTISGRR